MMFLRSLTFFYALTGCVYGASPCPREDAWCQKVQQSLDADDDVPSLVLLQNHAAKVIQADETDGRTMDGETILKQQGSGKTKAAEDSNDVMATGQADKIDGETMDGKTILKQQGSGKIKATGDSKDVMATGQADKIDGETMDGETILTQQGSGKVKAAGDSKDATATGQADEIDGEQMDGETILQQQGSGKIEAAGDSKDVRATGDDVLMMLYSGVYDQASFTTTMVGIAVALILCGVAHQVAGSDAGQKPVNKLVAEFVGTYMLIFCVGCNVLVGNPTWKVTSIACTLMVSIYTFASVSGANFNPAVSVSLGLTNKLSWNDVIAYISVQLAAGLAASISYTLMLGKTTTLGPSTGFTWSQAGLAELLYTFMLTFVVLNAATSKLHAGKDQFYGLAIAFTVVAGGYGAGSISGGCFNPAVALGVWSSNPTGVAGLLEYWIFELIGCTAAAALYRTCRPEDIPGSDSDDGSTHPLSSRLLSEYLGTFFLVMTVGLNVLGDSKAGAFSIAASLMCMIYALGSVSGAHFNPAVTTAIFASGREIISGKNALAYVFAQCLGAVSAAFGYSYLMNGRTVPLAPGAEHGIGQALSGEFAFTFLLCLTVLALTTTQLSAQPQFFGLAIGSCVTAGGFAIGSISGGSLNPAVSAGLSFSNCIISGGPIVNFFSYGFVELLAGVAAAQVVSFTHAAQLK